MKLAPRQIEGFLKAPPPELRAALIFGEDAGLVRERADALARTVVPTLDDPFLVSDLSADQLQETPARLAEEAAALAMTGGRRVVLVRDASDKLLKCFEEFLSGPVGDALIVAWGGELPARSKLRKLFEGADQRAAALPCYLDDEGALAGLIETRMRADRITLEGDAQRYLVDHLGADRALSRAEIDKLALYAGPGGRLTLEDVTAAIGDSAATALDDVIHAACDGEAAALDRAVEEGFAVGLHPVPMLRQTTAHVVRLRLLRGEVDSGRDALGAVKAARPPIFWKHQDRVARQVRSFDAGALADALALLLDAEAQCKTSGAPDRLTASRALHQIAALARRGRAAARR
ncbi:MAG: DNA polymerase III subunit delta [Alphaproteobacteria bacterium]|nr:DNA polymerase III subunit delta [Alphaproteobacteria bacterium]